MNDEINQVMASLINAGGYPLYVGGCVRDKLLHKHFPEEFDGDSNDVDIEVYRLAADDVAKVISQFGKVNAVGKSFGVIKLSTPSGEYDFSLPRRENKTGKGEKGFQAQVDHTMQPADAAARRDFTMNSVAMDINGRLHDPFNGEHDIKHRVLRATSEHFDEDPLRVLRGMQFAARFNMQPEPATVQRCAALGAEYGDLPADRVRGEWRKWATLSRYPMQGLQFLLATGWIALYPELQAIVDCPQDPQWHPEGCVMTHTGYVCDAAAAIAERDALTADDRTILLLAALCHDLGKATTTWKDPADNRWRAPRHAQQGEQPSRSLLARFGFGEKVAQLVVPLVREHMCHVGASPNRRFVRRLSARLAPATLKQVVQLIEADHSGRPPLPPQCPVAAQQILALAARLDIENGKPKPLVSGRDLMTWCEPGPAMGAILKQLYEEQLDGVFATREQGIERARVKAGGSQ